MQEIWDFIKKSDKKYDEAIQDALDKKKEMIKKASEETLIEYNKKINQAKLEANKMMERTFKELEEYRIKSLEENIEEVKEHINNSRNNINSAVEEGFREIIDGN